MAVRKATVGILFIALMLSSYLYLINKYNIHTVEYAFEGDISYMQFEDLRKSTKAVVKKTSADKELICVLNYIGSYKGNRLIMTTGYDNLISSIPMVKGNFIGDIQVREAVLGDKAADRLFSSIDVVGQIISISRQKYKIVGVIKNSEDIYITFDEGSNISWSKKNIKFIIENQKYLYLYTEMLEGKLRILNLDILARVIYKQAAYLYINIMLVIIILFLIKTMKKQTLKTIKAVKETYIGYKEQSRHIEIIQYLKIHVYTIFRIILELSISAIYMTTIIRCILFLKIPPTAIPNNLFSLSSYVEVAKLNVHYYFQRLNYGISGITQDSHIINLSILLALIGAQFYINKNRQNQEKSKIDGQ